MRIDVAREFAKCVRALNGKVLDDELSPRKDANADYWFPDDLVIAELKCLSANLFEQSDFKERTTRRHSSWVHRGLMPAAAPGAVLTLNLRDIPEVCASEFLRVIKRRIEKNVIAKANTQIKSTRKTLAAKAAKGLLILVNDGDLALQPNVVAYLLAHTLRTQNSSISSVIYFSANEFVTVPGHDDAGRFWIETTPSGREPVSARFREGLRAPWIEHHGQLIPGGTVQIMLDSDPRLLDAVHFTRARTSPRS